MIEGIDLKVISVYLINDYAYIADLHMFVSGRAECVSISLKCTKVKLKLNNFGFDCTKRCYWDGCNFTRRNLDIFVSGWLKPLGI